MNTRDKLHETKTIYFVSCSLKRLPTGRVKAQKRDKNWHSGFVPYGVCLTYARDKSHTFIYLVEIEKDWIWPSQISDANGHITLNTPVLVRSPKLSNVESSQYLDGWPPGNTGCCWLNSTFWPSFQELCPQWLKFLWKMSYLKQTTSNLDYWQNSQFQSLIFHKIHNLKLSFFTKFTI